MKDEDIQSRPPIRVGRVTAALLLVIVGILLLIDQIWSTSWIRIIFTWWPLLLMCWGVEIIWFDLRQSKRKRKLDVLGMFGAVFISALVFTAAQPNLFQDWIRSIQFDFSMMKQVAFANEIKLEQPKITEALSPEVSSILIEHSTGDVYVRSGDVEQLELSSLLTLYNSNEEQSRVIADHVHLQMVKDTELEQWMIKTVGLNTISDSDIDIRIDMELVVPLESSVPMQIKLDHGNIYMDDLAFDVLALTLNGDLIASNLGGKAELVTRNGNIDLQEVHNAVTAELWSGDLTLNSSVTAGDWYIQALAGDVTIYLPEDADLNVNAEYSFGEVLTTFPLDASKQTISGILGGGTYQLNIEVNGDLVIYAHE